MRSNKQPLTAIEVPDARLKMATVIAITALSESSIRRKIDKGEFPTPIKDGARCTRWVARDVTAWLRAR